MTDSNRIPLGIQMERVPESALNTASQPASHLHTSSRTDALGRGRADETKQIARLRDIHPLDALAVTLAWIRGDWNLGAVRGVLARCNGSHHELAERALRVALAMDSQGRFLAATPAAIENAGAIRREPVAQTYPTVAEALEPLDARLCPCGSGSLRGACPPHRTQEDR